MSNLKVRADVYDYTTQCPGGILSFPMTEEEINDIEQKGHELMVDYSLLVDVPGPVGVSIREFNKIAVTLSEAGAEEYDLKILKKTYTADEIVERYQNGGSFCIVDFDAETKNWMSASFHSESDKGRVLYDMGYIAFPVPVPEELEEYMDYAELYRSESVNMSIREVTLDNEHYLVF